jgi:hypothetical protein
VTGVVATLSLARPSSVKTRVEGESWEGRRGPTIPALRKPHQVQEMLWTSRRHAETRRHRLHGRGASVSARERSTSGACGDSKSWSGPPVIDAVAVHGARSLASPAEGVGRSEAAVDRAVLEGAGHAHTGAGEQTDDAELRAFEASAAADVQLPIDAHVIGEPVAVTKIRYAGVPRVGLLATCQRGERSRNT